MYTLFSLLKRIWVRTGMPCKRTVYYIRHSLLGKRWPARKECSVLVIIPTAGVQTEMLQKCLDALYNTAQNVTIRPVIVVAPATPDTTKAVTDAVESRAQVLPLSAFNYPHSLNEGIAQRTNEDYVLLLNDDCFFTQEHSLQRLLSTLEKQQWACIGPWVRNEARDDGITLHSKRAKGAVPLTEPVPGMCVLWKSEWLSRIGEFDTQFGEGYGCDEADYSLRARNRGARWGRDDSVEVHHLHHATFGTDANITSPKHQHNLGLWREKYPGIDSWGKGVHWQPLPGIHVAVAGHNVSPWIERALQSIEASLDGYRWILTYADDASTDDSLQKVLQHRTSAQHTIVRSFPKARGAAEAKNRAIAMGRPFADAYPVLCLMDSDDVMLPARIQLLLPQMYDNQYSVVFGDYLCTNTLGESHVFSADASMQQSGIRLHPCSTLIHWSLVPSDGALFAPELSIKEDEQRWKEWYKEGVQMQPITGACVHHYIERFNSVMRGGAADTGSM